MTLRELTTPTRVAPARYFIDVPDGWQQGRGAFGGLVLAMLTRAAEDTLADPTRTLRSLTGELFAPTEPGPAQLHTEVLRSGNAVSTLSARLIQGGELRAHAVCMFGRARPNAPSWSEPRPVPEWQSAPVAHLPAGLAPVFSQHVEFRPLSGFPYSGAREGVSGFVRFLDPGPARDAAFLVACADAYWPVALSALSAPRPMATIAFTLELLAPMTGLPPDAPVYHEATAPAAEDGYIVELRTLRGVDGRVLALNQQSFVVIK